MLNQTKALNKVSKPKQENQNSKIPNLYTKIGENPNEPTSEEVIKAYESVYLIKWLFPETSVKQY